MALNFVHKRKFHKNLFFFFGRAKLLETSFKRLVPKYYKRLKIWGQ